MAWFGVSRDVHVALVVDRDPGQPTEAVHNVERLRDRDRVARQGDQPQGVRLRVDLNP